MITLQTAKQIHEAKGGEFFKGPRHYSICSRLYANAGFIVSFQGPHAVHFLLCRFTESFDVEKMRIANSLKQARFMMGESVQTFKYTSSQHVLEGFPTR